jgi:hypothetical protein
MLGHGWYDAYNKQSCGCLFAATANQQQVCTVCVSVMLLFIYLLFMNRPLHSLP